MPIPFLVAGVAIAMGGVVSHCAKEVADDYQDELNSINRSMERMQDETNERVSKSKSNFENNITALTHNRNAIYKTTLTNFSKSFSKIKNVEFENNKKFKENFTQFNTSMVAYSDNSKYRSEFWDTSVSTVLSTAVFGVGGVFVGSMVSSIKTMYQIDEAKAERSKLRAECESAELECVKLNSLTQYCKTAKSTLSSLKTLTDKGVRGLDRIISESGTDYARYTEQEKQQVRLVVNLAMAVNDMISTDVFDNNGEINPQFNKFIEGASDLRL